MNSTTIEKAGAVEPMVKPTTHCIHGVFRSEHCPVCFSHEKILKLQRDVIIERKALELACSTMEGYFAQTPDYFRDKAKKAVFPGTSSEVL